VIPNVWEKHTAPTAGLNIQVEGSNLWNAGNHLLYQNTTQYHNTDSRVWIYICLWQPVKSIKESEAWYNKLRDTLCVRRNGCSVTWMRQLYERNLWKTNFHPIQSSIYFIFYLRIKIISFHFRSLVDIFLDDVASWWMKDFRYTVAWSQIQLACTVITDPCDFNGTCMRANDRQYC
jgi:hypothetical protein